MPGLVALNPMRVVWMFWRCVKKEQSQKGMNIVEIAEILTNGRKRIKTEKIRWRKEKGRAETLVEVVGWFRFLID